MQHRLPQSQYILRLASPKWNCFLRLCPFMVLILCSTCAYKKKNFEAKRGRWRGWQSPGIKPKTPSLCSHCSATELYGNQTTSSPHTFSLYSKFLNSTMFYWCVHMVRALAVQARVPPMAANLSLSSALLEWCVFGRKHSVCEGYVTTWTWSTIDLSLRLRNLKKGVPQILPHFRFGRFESSWLEESSRKSAHLSDAVSCVDNPRYIATLMYTICLVVGSRGGMHTVNDSTLPSVYYTLFIHVPTLTI